MSPGYGRRPYRQWLTEEANDWLWTAFFIGIFFACLAWVIYQ
jgi:hypothetical protein